jgi:type 1 glutamine amidotransferase
MKRRHLPLLLGSALLPAAAPPLRVMLITGGHDHELSLYRIFDNPRFSTIISAHPSAYNSDLRRKADVLVLYDMVYTMPDEKKRTALRNFAEAGKGIVILHHAFCNYQDWPWYYEELAGGGYLNKPRGDRSVSGYHLNQTFTLENTAPDHPVAKGLPRRFTLNDELYKNCWHAPTNKVILKTSHELTDGPMVWQSAWQPSRVITILMGHDHASHQDRHYQRLLHNAIAFAGRS